MTAFTLVLRGTKSSVNLALPYMDNERPVTSGDKHMLAKLIGDCAPNNLGDSGNPEEPEVIVHNYMDITIYD